MRRAPGARVSSSNHGRDHARRAWGGVACAVALASGALSLVASGCGAQGEGEPPARVECDARRLLADKCGGRICHGGEDPAAGLQLVEPGVDARLSGIPASDFCDGRTLVVAGDPQGSLLLQKVGSAAPPCGERMPPRGDDLSEEEVDCIAEYIRGIEPGPSCETCGTLLCVELSTDEKHCGVCGMACDPGMICAEGICLNPCEEGQRLCGSRCVDTASDSGHCGRCGHVCGSGSSCEDSVCVCEPEAAASFSRDVLPILGASCGGSDCHTGGEPLSELDLSPARAYAELVGAAAVGCEEGTLVVPGNPDQSYLIDKLTGGELCRGKRMPLFADPLPDAAIAQFVGWICAGALDD